MLQHDLLQEVDLFVVDDAVGEERCDHDLLHRDDVEGFDLALVAFGVVVEDLRVEGALAVLALDVVAEFVERDQRDEVEGEEAACALVLEA